MEKQTKRMEAYETEISETQSLQHVTIKEKSLVVFFKLPYTICLREPALQNKEVLWLGGDINNPLNLSSNKCALVLNRILLCKCLNRRLLTPCLHCIADDHPNVFSDPKL